MPEGMLDGMCAPQAYAAPLSRAAVTGYELIDPLDFGRHGDDAITTTPTDSILLRCHHSRGSDRKRSRSRLTMKHKELLAI
jgi:hypothetical protein